MSDRGCGCSSCARGYRRCAHWIRRLDRAPRIIRQVRRPADTVVSVSSSWELRDPPPPRRGGAGPRMVVRP